MVVECNKSHLQLRLRSSLCFKAFFSPPSLYHKPVLAYFFSIANATLPGSCHHSWPSASIQMWKLVFFHKKNSTQFTESVSSEADIPLHNLSASGSFIDCHQYPGECSSSCCFSAVSWGKNPAKYPSHVGSMAKSFSVFFPLHWCRTAVDKGGKKTTHILYGIESKSFMTAHHPTGDGELCLWFPTGHSWNVCFWWPHHSHALAN